MPHFLKRIVDWFRSDSKVVAQLKAINRSLGYATNHLDLMFLRYLSERGSEFLIERSGMSKERAVVVTTKHRGVFFGYAVDTGGETIKLRAARNCIYWSSEVKGFLGLAATGPTKACRVGPAADIELRDITCVASATEVATKAWESGPWS